MRSALLLPALFLSSLSGCAVASPYYWVAGTADYATSSPTGATKDASGAVPVTALSCLPLREPSGAIPFYSSPIVRLGEGCVVKDGRTGDTCDLPTSQGPVRVVVKSVSIALTQVGRYYNGLPINVVVGGETVDGGRYVTYRFTGGARLRNETPQNCDAVARTLAPHAPPVART
jgi:hypothetical protein